MVTFNEASDIWDSFNSPQLGFEDQCALVAAHFIAKGLAPPKEWRGEVWWATWEATAKGSWAVRARIKWEKRNALMS